MWYYYTTVSVMSLYEIRSIINIRTNSILSATKAPNHLNVLEIRHRCLAAGRAREVCDGIVRGPVVGGNRNFASLQNVSYHHNKK